MSVHHQFLIRKYKLYPAGIRHPHETKFDNHLQDLKHSNYTLNIPLIPTTPEEMEDMFRLCSHVRFKIPQQVRATLENKHIMDFTLYALYRILASLHFSNAATFCLSVNICFLCVDTSRIGRCSAASQHILPRRLVQYDAKHFRTSHVSVQYTPCDLPVILSSFY